jgi:hypothetical protein
MRNTRMSSRSILLVLALFGAGTSHAHDGMIEINQASALAGGVNGSLPADPAGFPVRITASGSYVLTSDLVIANVSTDAIQIDGANPLNVSIDLNGFAIRGPVTCSGEGASLVCSPSGGTGQAIHSLVDPNLADAIMVRNGRIVGMPVSINLSSRTALVRDLIVMNSGVGIVGNGLLLDSTFTFNVHGSALTTGSIQVQNAIVADTLVSSNNADGIGVGAALLTRVTARDNNGTGIKVTSPTDSKFLVSDSSAVGNVSNGIDCSGGICLLIDNTIAENTLAQLSMSGCNGAYTNNVFYSGSGGPTGAACANGALPPNVCNGSLTCP